MSISLILLGAGSSTRFGLPVKKQWLRVGSEPLWLYVAKKLASFHKFDKIVCVGSGDEISYMKRYCDFDVVCGGDTRQQSLQNALKLIDSKHVMVTDVARACVSRKLFLRLLKLKDTADCIVPVLKPIDTIYYKNNPIDRDKINSIQTPQLSNTKALKEALKSKKEFTDDSSAIHANRGTIKFVKGSKKAFKLTRKKDLNFFTCKNKPRLDTFVGYGFDVHEFGEKRPLILGGVKVHESMGLKAHSDGDVLAHALMDALLGAIGAGDIGELFPDTNSAYKNANSLKLLKRVYNFSKSVGFVLVNCDITVIAQNPKINPFKEQMAKKIAKTLGIERFFVNIKATTTEKLGFVGRNEGVAVVAAVSMRFYNWAGK